MKKHEVKFTISKDGEVNMEVMNGEGESCLIATDQIQQRLLADGSVQKDDGKKPEYYSGVSVSQDQNIFGGSF